MVVLSHYPGEVIFYCRIFFCNIFSVQNFYLLFDYISFLKKILKLEPYCISFYIIPVPRVLCFGIKDFESMTEKRIISKLNSLDNSDCF